METKELSVDFNQLVLDMRKKPIPVLDGESKTEMRLGDLVFMVLSSDIQGEKLDGSTRTKKTRLAMRLLDEKGEDGSFPCFQLERSQKTMIESRALAVAEAGVINSLMYTRLLDAIDKPVKDDK